MLTGAFSVEALLHDHPDAMVMAMDGRGLSVAPPRAVTAGGHRILRGRSMVDRVAPVDLPALVDAVTEAVIHGRGSCDVRLRHRSERYTAHVLNRLDDLGVLVGILVPSAEPGGPEVAVVPPEPMQGMIELDARGTVLQADRAAADIVGWPQHLLAGHSALATIHSEDLATVVDRWMEMLVTRQETELKYRQRRQDSTWHWVSALYVPDLQPAGEPPAATGSGPLWRVVRLALSDIDDRERRARMARPWSDLLTRITAVVPVGLCQVDLDLRVVYANERWGAMFAVVADDLSTAVDAVAPPDRPRVWNALLAGVDRDEERDVEVSLDEADRSGSGRHLLIGIRRLVTGDGRTDGLILCAQDVTDSVLRREELEARASHDQLTGCLNRDATMTALNRVLAEATGWRTAIVFVDLDGFKEVNDQLGHRTGDGLLRAVAGRLRGAVRPDDMVGRLGGDEFLLILRDVDDGEQLDLVSSRIADALAGPFDLSGRTIPLRASIGVAAASGVPATTGDEPGGPPRSDVLVDLADRAMYCSKRAGRGRPVVASGRRPLPGSEDVDPDRR